MRRYIWQADLWPTLTVDVEAILPDLDAARKRQYALLGALRDLSDPDRRRATAETLAATTVDTSKIEGEHLDLETVRSSVARRLGVDAGGVRPDDRTDGVVEMVLDAVRNHGDALTHDRLRRWHAGLFPGTIDRPHPPWAGAYRTLADGPMRVLSGVAGRQRVHFEAPQADAVPAMMDEFLRWFDVSKGTLNGLVRAAVSHLWFLTIHPFNDGNGRIARAIADLALAQDEASNDRFYSLSSRIQRERRAYYDALERAQRGTLDVSAWVAWFAGCMTRAVDDAETALGGARAATAFWRRHPAERFNKRQRKVLEKRLGAFTGELNVRKYTAIADCSTATAQRDLGELVALGVLAPAGRARATRYLLEPSHDATPAS